MSGWVARKILRKAALSPKKQALEAAKNCSPELYATSSTSKRDGVKLENTEGDFQNNAVFGVEYSCVESNT